LDKIIAQLKSLILIADTGSNGDQFDEFAVYLGSALTMGFSMILFELTNGKEGQCFNPERLKTKFSVGIHNLLELKIENFLFLPELQIIIANNVKLWKINVSLTNR
jgi:hypothetical protein